MGCRSRFSGSVLQDIEGDALDVLSAVSCACCGRGWSDATDPGAFPEGVAGGGVGQDVSGDGVCG